MLVRVRVCANVCVCARPAWVPRLVHVAARRDGRVQPRELRQRAHPAADRAGEAVRAKRAAHPPRAWAAKRRCAAGRAAWPPRGGRAHRVTRSVSLPSSGGSVPLSLLPAAFLPRRRCAGAHAGTTTHTACTRRRSLKYAGKCGACEAFHTSTSHAHALYESMCVRACVVVCALARVCVCVCVPTRKSAHTPAQ
jgi:hypothetical protein